MPATRMLELNSATESNLFGRNKRLDAIAPVATAPGQVTGAIEAPKTYTQQCIDAKALAN